MSGFYIFMTNTKLNIIVCTDPRRCSWIESYGRNGTELLQELVDTVEALGMEEQVRVTSCRCIFGCTYGPRIDLVDHKSGQKVLYGIGTGEVRITRRGKVSLHEIPEDISEMITRYSN